MQLLLLQQETDIQEKSSAAPMWKKSYHNMQLKLVLEVKLTNISIIHRGRNL